MSDPTPANGSPRLPPWDDIDAWRRLFAEAEGLARRREVVMLRAQAAGGCVNGPALALPRELRPGLALAELRTQARLVGLRVETVG